MIAAQNGLVQEHGSDCIHQGATQIDITHLDDGVADTFVLTVARVVATTDQTRPAKDLTGVGIVVGVPDGSGQAGDLNGTEAFEWDPDPERGLGN